MNKRIAAVLGLFLLLYSSVSSAFFISQFPSGNLACSNYKSNGSIVRFSSLGGAYNAGVGCVQIMVDKLNAGIYYDASIV